jgi:excisionase family DNA binding protein
MPSRSVLEWKGDMPDLNEFISTEEAAEKLEYHVEHVRRMMREGSIAGLKIGRTWLVRREALDSYMKRTASMAKHDPRRNK